MCFRMGMGKGKAHIKDILLCFKIRGKYPKIWRNQKEILLPWPDISVSWGVVPVHQGPGSVRVRAHARSNHE